MKPNHFIKASLLALLLVICFIGYWEHHWRADGFTISYNDDKVLWAAQRKQVYRARDSATVFIGGSRIKFDLDIPTWEKLTGEEVVQLAMVGTPARLILLDLAKDENFHGKLIIDEAETQFFSLSDSVIRDKSAKAALQYYHNETPAQKTSAWINQLVESKMVFLEEGKLGFNSLWNGLPMTNRTGVPPYTSGPFSKECVRVTSDRQNIFTPMFLSDPGLLKNTMERYKKGQIRTDKIPPLKGEALEILLAQFKKAIDRIRSRGGKVLFIRPPSNGTYLAKEKEQYPRMEYWDRLLEYTNTPGYHFADFPPTAGLTCYEESHLRQEDAVIYTKSLVEILKKDGYWDFPKAPNGASKHHTNLNP